MLSKEFSLRRYEPEIRLTSRRCPAGPSWMVPQTADIRFEFCTKIDIISLAVYHATLRALQQHLLAGSWNPSASVEVLPSCTIQGGLQSILG